jgi:hypothetical protein
LIIRPERGSDVLDRQVVYIRLGTGENDLEFNRVQTFAYVITQGRVEGKSELNNLFISPGSSAEDLTTAFERFLDIPPHLMVQIVNALNTVNQPIGDPDLLPEDQLPEKKSATPLSSKSEGAS